MKPFSEHVTLRAVIEAALEGRVGKLVHDDPASPSVSRVDLGCYTIFSGDAASPRAFTWLSDLDPPAEILLPPGQDWRDLADRILGDELVDRPMRTYDPHDLDVAFLEHRAGEHDEAITISPLDRTTASQLGEALQPHALQAFTSLTDFDGDAFGFVATTSNGRAISQASSYAVSSKRVEVAVATDPDHRGRGLGTAVAARMLAESLRRGLLPEWSASNPISKRIARGLGYRPGLLCDIVEYAPDLPHQR